MTHIDTFDQRMEDFWDRLDQLAMDEYYDTFDLGWAVFRNPRMGGSITCDAQDRVTLVLDRPWVEAMVEARREDAVVEVVRTALRDVRGGWIDRPIEIPRPYRTMRRDWLARGRS